MWLWIIAVAGCVLSGLALIMSVVCVLMLREVRRVQLRAVSGDRLPEGIIKGRHVAGMQVAWVHLSEELRSYLERAVKREQLKDEILKLVQGGDNLPAFMIRAREEAAQEIMAHVPEQIVATGLTEEGARQLAAQIAEHGAGGAGVGADGDLQGLAARAEEQLSQVRPTRLEEAAPAPFSNRDPDLADPIED
jgi:hypothetical protein